MKIGVYSNLEMQAQLLMAELELLAQSGYLLPKDVVICMNNFRKMEQAMYGSTNKNLKEMLTLLKNSSGQDTN